MAQTLALALLPLLAVSMVTRAAPLAEQAAGKEVAVVAPGDSSAVDIAKRAKEEIVFGNQQNSARLGAAKKSSGPQEQQQQHLAPLEDVPAAPQQTPTEVQAKTAVETPDQPSAPVAVAAAAAAAAAAGDDVPKEAEQSGGAKGVEEEEESVPEPLGTSNGEPTTAADEKQSHPSGSEESQEEAAQHQHQQQEQEQESQSAAVPEGVEEQAEEKDQRQQQQQQQQQEQEQQQQDQASQDPQLLPVEEGGVHNAQEESSANAQDTEQPHQPASQPDSTDQRHTQDSENDQNQDSERALQSLHQPETIAEEDEVENLLKDLHPDHPAEGKGEGEEESEGDEGSAERELMQVNSELAAAAADAGDAGGADAGAENAYTQSLLKYILSHGDEYGRLPQHSGYMYPADPYYLQRRRRSSVTSSRLPHIHRRRRRRNNISTNTNTNNINNNKEDEKELSRAKRTKRDLFDDNLYYNAYDPRVEEDLEKAAEAEEKEQQQKEEEEEEEQQQAEKDAEVRELLAYLMALYPALYDRQQPEPQFPAYLWEGASYPQEDDVVEEPYWAQPAAYEEPAMEWEEPEVEAAPAWEPSFYPEEVEEEPRELEGEGEEEVEDEDEVQEEPEFYPIMAKRQMMSFVPGERRKRYFFPFAREPYTHWGAFVPSQTKRDYFGEDPYRRLKELALVLADDRQPSYIDTAEEYKKK